MSRLVSLIRGINLGSARKLPMADLRVACADAGLGKVETYIQSGNLVLDHDNPPLTEIALEELISTHFGLDVPVVARTATEWEALIAACPFPSKAEAEPRKLHILVCKHQPFENAVDMLVERARDGEKVARWDNELAIHFTNGVGTSRLLPARIDRLICTPATAWNWNTVLKPAPHACARAEAVIPSGYKHVFSMAETRDGTVTQQVYWPLTTTAIPARREGLVLRFRGKSSLEFSNCPETQLVVSLGESYVSRIMNLSHPRIAGLAIASGLIGCGAPVLAQTAALAETSSPSPLQAAIVQTKDDNRNEIVVTGTHIARPELESAMPISVTSVADAKNFARDTLYDALTLNPAIGPGLGAVNSGGQEYDQGVANINLRNLGTNRSLVLVDGQRWVSGGARTQAVDLNTIPSALIDRTEVVTGGASAIYGADAITGAVNVITKKQVQGVHLSVTNGISGRGDAAEKRAEFSTGKKFADGRGHIVLGADWTSTDPITDADRGLTNDRYVYVTNNKDNLRPGVPRSTGPADGIADQVLVNSKSFYRSTVPTWCVYQGRTPCGTSNNGQFYQFVNGQVVPIPQSSYTVYSNGDVGTQTDNGSGGLPSTVDGLYTNILLRAKSVKASGMLRADYELTPTTIFNVYGSYAHSYTRANTEWPVVRDDERATNWYGGNSGEIATLANPFLPNALRQYMVANNLASIPFDRTYANLPVPWEIHARNNISAGADVSGKLADRVNWGVAGRFGQVIDHIRTENALGGNEWLAARNAVTLNGQIVCADAAARAAGCVPFNFFTTDAPSEAFDNYALKKRYERTMNSLVDFSSRLDGSLLHLPYGDLQFAAGVEWRQETLHTQDDPDSAKVADIILGGADYASHPNLFARRRTAEAYGEVDIPLLKELPFAYRLTIEGAYRYSHYSDNPHTNTWKAGGTWSPIRGITFRGTYSYAVRVPNFGELDAPFTSAPAPAAAIDPCDALNITNSIYKAGCQAVLALRGGKPLPDPGTNRPLLLSGGNPNLTPETSRSYTIGMVLQPKFLRGFDLTVDYWKINIKNVITTLSNTTILNNCYAGMAGYCQYVVRNPTGTGYQPGYNATNDPTGLYLLDGMIYSVANNQYVNLADLEARGIDIGANYRTRLGQGEVRVGFAGQYLLNQITVAQAGGAGLDYAGQYRYPRFRGTLLTSYSVGKTMVSANTRFVGATKYDPTRTDEFYEFQHIPMYIYNDVAVSLRATRRITISAGVNNISNVAVPLQLYTNTISPHQANGSTTGAGGAAYYDSIGRFFFAKINLNI